MLKRSRLIGAAALMLALLAGAPAAQARTAAAPVAYTCPAPSLSSVFAPWYDWSLYMRAPAGGFDTGAGAWSVAGSVTAVSDDNPLLGGVSGRSLQLAPGASVTSPVFCDGIGYPYGRIFHRGVTAGTRISVAVLHIAPDGSVSGITSGGLLFAGTNWAPSVKFALAQGFAQQYGARARLRFTVTGTAAARIDDIFVDPRLSR